LNAWNRECASQFHCRWKTDFGQMIPSYRICRGLSASQSITLYFGTGTVGTTAERNPTCTLEDRRALLLVVYGGKCGLVQLGCRYVTAVHQTGRLSFYSESRCVNTLVMFPFLPWGCRYDPFSNSRPLILSRVLMEVHIHCQATGHGIAAEPCRWRSCSQPLAPAS
jgi:hypothetical protein